MSQLTKEDLQKIASSILAHRETIMKDINLSIRLETKEEKVYTTRLTRWDGAHLYFDAPLEQRDYVLFMVPSILSCRLVTKKAIFETQINVIDKQRKDEKLMYKVEIIAPIIKKQQRQHFRLSALTPFEYTVVKRLKDETFLPQPQKATSVNISVGGMCMVCNDKLYKADELQVNMDFVNTTFVLDARVLSDGDRNENGTYCHRIQFVNMDAKTMNNLTRLIFEKQRLMMRSTNVPLFKKKS